MMWGRNGERGGGGGVRGEHAQLKPRRGPGGSVPGGEQRGKAGCDPISCLRPATRAPDPPDAQHAGERVRPPQARRERPRRGDATEPHGGGGGGGPPPPPFPRPSTGVVRLLAAEAVRCDGAGGSPFPPHAVQQCHTGEAYWADSASRRGQRGRPSQPPKQDGRPPSLHFPFPAGVVTTVRPHLDGVLRHGFARVALQAEHDLLRRLSLCVSYARGGWEEGGGIRRCLSCSSGHPGGAGARRSSRASRVSGTSPPSSRGDDMPHLFVEDGLRLPSVARLLSVVTPLACGAAGGRESQFNARRTHKPVNVPRLPPLPPILLTLRVERGLAGFVLRDLVHRVLFAVLALGGDDKGKGDIVYQVRGRLVGGGHARRGTQRK